MAELSGIGQRFSASEGERAMLHEVKERLPEGVHARIDPFVAHTTPELVASLHAALILAGGLIGFAWPVAGGVLTAATTASLVAESSGLTSPVRWLLPKAPSYNLVTRIGGDRPLGAVIFAAPLDLPRWRPDALTWFRRPVIPLLAAAIFVVIMLALRTMAEPWAVPTLGMYVGALGGLAVSVLVLMGAHRRERGDGRGDASAPAALLELVRRFDADPIPGLEVWAVFSGCSHAHQGGMHSFLALRGDHLPDPALVVALEQPGQAPLMAAVSEGSMFRMHHRATGPALVERLNWAGVDVPMVDRPGGTDARAAMVRGFRGLALIGGDVPSTSKQVAHAVEVAERISRWFGEDLVRIASDRPQAVDDEPAGDAEDAG